MSVSITGMIKGNLNHLRFIRRFSTCFRINDETVAEHGFYVAIYALLIAKDFEYEHAVKINWEVLLGRALLHDIEECVTGDVPRAFKHISPELTRLIEQNSVGAAEAVIKELHPQDSSAHIRTLIKHLWASAKTDDFEGNIVHFADFLSVLSYVAQELYGNNRFFIQHAESLQEYAGTFRHSRFDFLRKYVDEANHLLTEMLSRE